MGTNNPAKMTIGKNINATAAAASSSSSSSTNTTTTKTNNLTTNTVRRELGIASSFVRQYYTLLNKAPGYICNFYSNYSTFIHGNIEIGNDHYTEPVVGREEIKRKMENMNLNDCRAKIKQIDCLDTLAGGLVIQVIGELSNDGKPMRRFLQTFVLAPSPNDARSQDVDSNHSKTSRDVHPDDASSHNEKFFVLNSIFRYLEDGRDVEFESEQIGNVVYGTVDPTNGDLILNEHKPLRTNASSSNLNGSVCDGSQIKKRSAADSTEHTIDDVERLASDLKEGVKFNKPNIDQDPPKKEIIPNGGNNLATPVEAPLSSDKNNEPSERPATENGKPTVEHSQAFVMSTSMLPANQTPSQPTSVTRPQPPNEPKTWANAVRNAHPTSAPIQMNSSKTAQDQQPQQIANQSSQTSVQSQQQPNSHQPNQQPNNNNNISGSNNSNNNANNSNNSRRRHVMRKPSNKSGGRMMKRDKARQSAPKPPI